MKAQEIIVINRNVNARLIPSGALIQLQTGTEVMMTQDLGGNFTVNVYGNLVSIDAADADALGREVENPLGDIDFENTPIKELVWMQLKTCYDPEIPVNIVDLGLVYNCDIRLIEAADDTAYEIEVEMTLTAPGCGMGPVIAENAKTKLLQIPTVNHVHVEIVFDPPWTQDKMSDAAKLQLGLL